MSSTERESIGKHSKYNSLQLHYYSQVPSLFAHQKFSSTSKGTPQGSGFGKSFGKEVKAASNNPPSSARLSQPLKHLAVLASVHLPSNICRAKNERVGRCIPES